MPVALARPHIQALAQDSGEAVLLGAYEPARQEMMFLDVVQAVHPLHYDVGLHRFIPVHSGATGLAILAHLPEAERRAVYAAGLPRLTDATLVAVDELERDLRPDPRAGLRALGRPAARGRGRRHGTALRRRGQVLGDVSMTVPSSASSPSGRSRWRRGLATATAVTDELRRAGHRRG